MSTTDSSKNETLGCLLTSCLLLLWISWHSAYLLDSLQPMCNICQSIPYVTLFQQYLLYFIFPLPSYYLISSMLLSLMIYFMFIVTLGLAWSYNSITWSINYFLIVIFPVSSQSPRLEIWSCYPLVELLQGETMENLPKQDPWCWWSVKYGMLEYCLLLLECWMWASSAFDYLKVLKTPQTADRAGWIM